MRHSLERHPAFKPVAWFIFIGAAVCLLYLIASLQTASAELSKETKRTLDVIEAGASADFEQ